MKAKKLLALLLTMLMLVSSMAMATLPVLAEEAAEVATIPAVKMAYYAGAADQYAGVNLNGLTEGETYAVSLFVKGTGQTAIVLNGTPMFHQQEALNGAVYNTDTGLLSFTFTAAAINDLKLQFIGSNNASAHVAGLTVATTTGVVVLATEGVYTDGALTKIATGGTNWGDAWGNSAYITYVEVPTTTFGVADRATCEHDYTNDCDIMCDACGTFRESAGHQYDDKYDEYCNNCNEYRYVPTEVATAYLYYYAGAANYRYGATVSGLTVNDVYTLSVYFKAELGLPAVSVDGTFIIEGTTVQNGATYENGLLTYSFVASSDKAEVELDLHGGNYAGGYIGGLTVVDATGNVVYTSAGAYAEDGTLTGLKDWTKRGESWYNFVTWSEKPVTFFGATDVKLCEEHVYVCDCDPFCNNCGAVREIEGHQYTDEYDSLCNVCQELRLPNAAIIYGASLSYWAGGADQYYGRDFGELLTIGETYTFTAFVTTTGSGGMSFNGTPILTGTTPADGATLENGVLTYTFTAADTNEDGIADAYFKVELFGSNSETSTMIYPVLADAAGNVVVAPALRYDDNGNMNGLEGWKGSGNYNVDGFGQYITVQSYPASQYGVVVDCFHRYAGPCDGTCDYCGEVRELGAHEYDDDADSRCNNCYNLRDGWVNALDAKAYSSDDDTLGWVTNIKGLTIGETYTLTFYWKAMIGTPVFRFWTEGSADYAKEIIKGMEVMDDNTTFDYKTGIVTHIFTADVEEFTMGIQMNTLDPENTTQSARILMADVVITDSMGEEFFRNDITTDAERGWGWTGWSNRWNNSQRGHMFIDYLPSVFACTHVYDDCDDLVCNRCEEEREAIGHTYDGGCDADCNVCGKVREDVAHEYDNACDMDCNVCGAIREVEGHVFDNNCDADCNECGELREVGEHVYSNACDVDCNECGATRTVGDHVYDDDNDPDCNECGEIREIEATHTPGDINGDGEVDNRDVTRLIRYLNEWDVEYVEAALDINGDGEIDNRDATRLTRYINEWDVEIF